uniref:hypothetical protein n=1 Tax=Candidatus Ventrenecus sp. TaxID=3085654 RepID=UPI003FEE8986
MSTTLAIIKKASQGFVFLGYYFKVFKKKTIVKIRSETRKKIYKTIKRCYKNYEDVLLSMTNKINLKKE